MYFPSTSCTASISRRRFHPSSLRLAGQSTVDRVHREPFTSGSAEGKGNCLHFYAPQAQSCAFFASGSPFPTVKLGTRSFVSGQGNNSYIVPGVGLGVLASQSSRVTNEMFLVAARALAGLVTEEDLALGRVYPALDRIREVSATIALDVAENAFARGFARQIRPADLFVHIQEYMYQPDYAEYV